MKDGAREGERGEGREKENEGREGGRARAGAVSLCSITSYNSCQGGIFFVKVFSLRRQNMLMVTD